MTNADLQEKTLTVQASQPIAPPSSSQRVMDAVRELARLEQVATRENVAELTGLTLTVVDDRLKVLTDDGKLRRILKGIYTVAISYPEPRAITVTEIPDGWVTVDVGDQTLVLSPKEARMLGRGLAGHVDDFRAGESINRHLVLATDMAAKVEQLSREVRALKERPDSRQATLALEGN